jgi:hypothetical protein
VPIHVDLEGDAEYAGLRGVADRLLQSHPMWWEPGAVPLAAHEHRPRVPFRIRIGRVTGRRAELDAAKPMPGRAAKPAGSRWLTQVFSRVLRRRTVAVVEAPATIVHEMH